MPSVAHQSEAGVAGSAARYESHPDRSIERDARDLHRGVMTNFLGYLLKIGNPVLLVVVVRKYGAEAFGLYTLAQAVMLFAARMAVYGFDKGLLWWIPRQAAANKRLGVRSSLFAVTLLGTAVASLLALGAQPSVLSYFGADPAAVVSLRIMAAGVLLQAWMDILVHSALGMRKMAAQVFAKETIVPATFMLSAVGFHLMGVIELGLAFAFLLSNLVGLMAAIQAFRRAFRGIPWPTTDETLWPPRELVRYSGPMWLSELANSLLQRVDTYAVGLFTSDLASVGVYAVVTRFGNAIRQIRRSFDTIVLAITSEISTHHDPERLAVSYSHATLLVGITQVPVFAAIWTFADLLMPLFGPEFTKATEPLLILCAFWIVNGAISLAGIVVSAYGHSRLTLQNVLVAVVVLVAACFLLIPRSGLVGAAYAVGIGYSVQGAFQVVQMRMVTGYWNYRSEVLLPFQIGGAAALAAGIVWLVESEFSMPSPWLGRSLVFAAFAAVYGAGVVRLRGQGRFAMVRP
jgi:O-antigen/teichoic acid export membrane protein